VLDLRNKQKNTIYSTQQTNNNQTFKFQNVKKTQKQ